MAVAQVSISLPDFVRRCAELEISKWSDKILLQSVNNWSLTKDVHCGFGCFVTIKFMRQNLWGWLKQEQCCSVRFSCLETLKFSRSNFQLCFDVLFEDDLYSFLAFSARRRQYFSRIIEKVSLAKAFGSSQINISTSFNLSVTNIRTRNAYFVSLRKILEQQICC